MTADLHDLPHLPLPSADPKGEGVGCTVSLGRDKFGRWVARIVEDGRVIDRLEPELTPNEALMAVSRNYPQARWSPPKQRRKT